MEEEIGVVTHYYPKIGVAVVKLTRKSLSSGQTVHVQGNSTDFVQQVTSMQIEHKNIEKAKKGDEFGLKIDQKVREGDKVFLVE
mgnify:CR=1 FL=1